MVRIYAGAGGRGAHAAEVDAALLRLVRGLVPVPEVLEVRRADPGDRPAGAAGHVVPAGGARRPAAADASTTRGLARLGAALGDARWPTSAGMPMLRAGPFVDGDLTIGALPAALDGLPGVRRAPRARLLAGDRGELDGLRAVADDAQDLLDTVGRRCLVHSDLNPKNLLVDPDTLEVTGARGLGVRPRRPPCTDLGNLLRFDRDPAFADARAGGVPRRAADAPEDAAGPGPGGRPVGAGRPGRPRAGENPVAERADGCSAIARAGTCTPGSRTLSRRVERARRLDRRALTRGSLTGAPEVCLRPGRSGLTLAIARASPCRCTSDQSVVKQGFCACPHDSYPPKESTPL